MPEFQQFKLGQAIGDGQNIAMNQFRLGEAQRGVEARQGLTQALQAGTPEAMTQYSQQFPQEAAQHQQTQSALNQQKIKDMLLHFEVADKLMSGVNDEASYQRALQLKKQAGMDTSQDPPNYDPNFIMQKRQEALGFKGQLEMDLKKLQQQREDEKFAETKRSNRAKEANAASGNKPPAGYRWRQDGSLEPIPGGPGDPATKNQKMTDAERVAAGYAMRMEESEKIMGSVPAGEQKPGFGESMAATLPIVGKMSSNAARSDNRQMYRQAQEDWVRSKLRKESGAVIADEEMDREIRVYFPQIGDSDAVVAQKEKARQVAIDAMKQAAGPAYMGNQPGTNDAPRNPAERKAGTVYNTPKGLMKWTGTGWVPQ